MPLLRCVILNGQNWSKTSRAHLYQNYKTNVDLCEEYQDLSRGSVNVVIMQYLKPPPPQKKRKKKVFFSESNMTKALIPKKKVFEKRL